MVSSSPSFLLLRCALVDWNSLKIASANLAPPSASRLINTVGPHSALSLLHNGNNRVGATPVAAEAVAASTLASAKHAATAVRRTFNRVIWILFLGSCLPSPCPAAADAGRRTGSAGSSLPPESQTVGTAVYLPTRP